MTVPTFSYATDMSSLKKNENVSEIQTEGTTFLRNDKELAVLQKFDNKNIRKGLNIYFEKPKKYYCAGTWL
jgi:hypothetical protein